MADIRAQIREADHMPRLMRDEHHIHVGRILNLGLPGQEIVLSGEKNNSTLIPP